MSDPAGALLGPGRRLLPAGVRAVSTTRAGGVGRPPYTTLNLGTRAGDRPEVVACNRARLVSAAGLVREPSWLHQVHGGDCVELRGGESDDALVADAAWTRQPGVPCAVLTADCLPIVLVDRAGAGVGVAHAGWRGLAAGVIESVVAAMPFDPAGMRAWLGPAIGPGAFEVGPEVRAAFVDQEPDDAHAFRPGVGDRWLADLYAIARRRLWASGIGAVGGGGYCTFGEPERFFSHRRDGNATGRMATVAWLEA